VLAPTEIDRETPMQRTEPLPPQPTIDAAAARDVSIEELIDLEQQAEFFVVLGQDDAAIDLLVEHLRNTGGGSPLPYLKLLEIYHRLGEREHYERMRTRFNHRFNAYAPAWGVDLQAGRSLDSYPGVIPRLQQVWSRPLDAMAELEALLFRKSRGELFDLPAYREVLFLYSLARDLLDREAAAGDNVDLLLPLSDGGEFSSTSPAPFIATSTDHTSADRAAGLRATAAVDFDLSADTGPATSLLGPLDEAPDRPSRR
jgi:pilus assembly protein FimV